MAHSGGAPTGPASAAGAAALGCIGLGAMGLPMAARMLAAGHRVRGFDPLAAPLAQLTAWGGVAAASPAEAAQGAQVLLLMVHNAEQAHQALFGADGAAPCLAPGAVVWLAATVTADSARDLAERLAALRIGLLDGPVSGGVTSARSGTLTVIAGGDEAALAAAAPALQACASRVFHVGPVGAGASVKMINNLLAASHVALTAEALALGQRAGVDLAKLIEVVQHSSGQSRMFDKRAPRMAADEHEAQVAVRTFLKDLDIACDSARQLDVQLPVAEAAHTIFQRAADSGLAALSDTRLLDFYQRDMPAALHAPGAQGILAVAAAPGARR